MQKESQILITGASGLLGAQILRYLHAKGYHKLSIFLRNKKSLEKLNKVLSFFNDAALLNEVTVHYGDITDYYDVADACKGKELVFHAAALVSFHPLDKEKLLAVNYEGTAHVVNACIAEGVSTLAHVSSTAAIGKGKKEGALSEQDEFGDTDKEYVYGLSKHLAEREVWRGEAEGLKVVMINPSVIIGVTTDQQSSSSIYHTAAKGLKHYAPGGNALADAQDIAQILIQLVEDGHFGKRYLAFNALVSFKDLFSHTQPLMGKKAPSKELKPWLGAILWRVLAVFSAVTNRKSGFTKDAMTSAFKTTEYSRDQLDALYPHFPWKNWKASIEEYAPFYRKA